MQLFANLYKTLCEHADSRKSTATFVAVVAALLILFGDKLGLTIDPEKAKVAAGAIVAAVGVYVHAQGRADAAAGGTAPTTPQVQAPAGKALGMVEDAVVSALTTAAGSNVASTPTGDSPKT